MENKAVLLAKPEPAEQRALGVKMDHPTDPEPAPPSRRATASAPAKMEHDDDDSDDFEGDDSWERNSIMEQFIDDVSPPEYTSDPNKCTSEEARRYKTMLHELGLQGFIQETLGKAWFGPTEKDESCLRILGLALMKELQKRQRLPQYKTIDDAAKLLREAKKVLVVTGAGISTSLGIPDFRSKHTGFYSKLREQGYEEPEEVFELTLFDENPEVFFSLAGDILPDLHRYTPTHQFIRILQDKGKLLRNYTQNIDNIEAHAGVKRENLIQCHGSWATATCRKCRHTVPGEEIFESVQKKEVPQCKACLQSLTTPRVQGMKRKRSANSNGKPRKRSHDNSDDDSEYDLPEPGVMKPDITFFGERLPDTFFEMIQKDRNDVDLVIVMGTSMKVAPVSEIPGFVPSSVPQIYISRDPIYHINFDINLLGDCDAVVEELCRRAGWELKHEKGLSDDEVVKIMPFEDHDVDEHVWTVKACLKIDQADKVSTPLEEDLALSSKKEDLPLREHYPNGRTTGRPTDSSVAASKANAVVIELD